MERPKSGLAAALIVAAVLLMPVVYVAGYLTLGAEIPSESSCVFRVFDAEWQIQLFIPAAKVEATLSGRCVELFIGQPNSTMITTYDIWRFEP